MVATAPHGMPDSLLRGDAPMPCWWLAGRRGGLARVADSGDAGVGVLVAAGKEGTLCIVPTSVPRPLPPFDLGACLIGLLSVPCPYRHPPWPCPAYPHSTAHVPFLARSTPSPRTPPRPVMHHASMGRRGGLSCRRCAGTVAVTVCCGCAVAVLWLCCVCAVAAP